MENSTSDYSLQRLRTPWIGKDRSAMRSHWVAVMVRPAVVGTMLAVRGVVVEVGGTRATAGIPTVAGSRRELAKVRSQSRVIVARKSLVLGEVDQSAVLLRKWLWVRMNWQHRCVSSDVMICIIHLTVCIR